MLSWLADPAGTDRADTAVRVLTSGMLTGRLLDLCLDLVRDREPDEPKRLAVETAVALAKKANELRNSLVHATWLGMPGVGLVSWRRQRRGATDIQIRSDVDFVEVRDALALACARMRMTIGEVSQT